MLFKHFSSQPFKHITSQKVWVKAFSTASANASFQASGNIHQEAAQVASVEKELGAFNEFKEGLRYETQGKYNLAHEQFKRILDILEMSNLKGSDSHIYILKKLAKSQINLKNNNIAEKYLQSIVDSTSEAKNAIEKYKYSNNLLLFYLRNNLDKAVSLAKTISRQNKLKDLPSSIQGQLMLNLGTAYLLNGNYQEASKVLGQSAKIHPDNTFKGYALNNLALTHWWNQLYPGSTPGTSELSLEKVLPNFKDSIYYIENGPSIQGENQQNLKQLLSHESLVPKDAEKFNPDNQILITQQESNLPLLNVARYLFNTAPEKKNETTFWIKYAMKSFEKNDPENIGKVLMILANFYSNGKQYIRAEGLFRTALESLEQKDSFEKILCMEQYGKMLTSITNRKSEGETVIENAKKLAESYPSSAEKLTYISLPNIEL